MRPEEYRQIIKNLETHYEEFIMSSRGSQMFADDDKKNIETQFNVAQAHYDQLVVQLPTFGKCYNFMLHNIQYISLNCTNQQCPSVYN